VPERYVVLALNERHLEHVGCAGTPSPPSLPEDPRQCDHRDDEHGDDDELEVHAPFATRTPHRKDAVQETTEPATRSRPRGEEQRRHRPARRLGLRGSWRSPALARPRPAAKRS